MVSTLVLGVVLLSLVVGPAVRSIRFRQANAALLDVLGRRCLDQCEFVLLAKAVEIVISVRERAFADAARLPSDLASLEVHAA